MKSIMIAAALLAAAGAANAAQTANFGTNENSPRVQPFYQAKCKQWSSADWIQPAQREAFMQQCVKDMAAAWPVGMAKGGCD